MNEYKAEALTILTDFPDSEAKEAMIKLVRYTTERIK